MYTNEAPAGSQPLFNFWGKATATYTPPLAGLPRDGCSPWCKSCVGFISSSITSMIGPSFSVGGDVTVSLTGHMLRNSPVKGAHCLKLPRETQCRSAHGERYMTTASSPSKDTCRFSRRRGNLAVVACGARYTCDRSAVCPSAVALGCRETILKNWLDISTDSFFLLFTIPVTGIAHQL